MCGIFALLRESHIKTDDIKQLLDCIDRRGPDYCSPVIENVTNFGLPLKLKSSVLHLRGDECQRQPVIDMYGNILMFNGQIYKYSGIPIEKCKSDTTFLAEKLETSKHPEEVVEILTEVEGPFAFVYYHRKLRKLFYGRDLFGRKSLCVLTDSTSTPIAISSVAHDTLETDDLKWHEVNCSGIHCVDFFIREQVRKLTFFWHLDPIYPKTKKCEPIPYDAPGGPPLKITFLRPLNNDLSPPSQFDETTRSKVLQEFESIFLEAVRSRYKYNKATCLYCRQRAREDPLKKFKCSHSKVAVAFSGGVDSTLIALALDKILDEKETIDLVTVAFRPDSPDRESVGRAFKEIRNLCRNRVWRLVICDISKEELQQERDRRIRNLILPCDSVFDDGIGCACWFIGRGKGRAVRSSLTFYWTQEHFDNFLNYNPSPQHFKLDVDEDYECPASMLFVGSSIDEQLGGYSSHRKAWSDLGADGLNQEISFLMRRLSSRNLGRDDRVYCDHGRDLKLPFLDYQFVSFLNELPLGLKMNLDEPLDLGPKKILRELALKWGLEETGRRVKRAMQFGTRIANLEGTKERGNEVCSRLRPGNIDVDKPIVESTS